MSSYLNANQPYQRVDDGIGAGLIGGAVVGGALAGATHRWGKQGLQVMGNRAIDKRAKTFSEMDNFKENVTDSKVFSKSAEQFDSAGKKLNQIKWANDKHSKVFNGGWKGKAAAYGGSIIAAGLLGAAGDAMID